MQTQTTILNFLKEHKERLKEQFGVQKIGLFGSFARNEYSDSSDIDIAVEIESQNKFRSFFNLKYYLEEHLHHSVDLGIESSLKPIAKEYVSKEIIYV